MGVTCAPTTAAHFLLPTAGRSCAGTELVTVPTDRTSVDHRNGAMARPNGVSAREEATDQGAPSTLERSAKPDGGDHGRRALHRWTGLLAFGSRTELNAWRRASWCWAMIPTSGASHRTTDRSWRDARTLSLPFGDLRKRPLEATPRRGSPPLGARAGVASGRSPTSLRSTSTRCAGSRRISAPVQCGALQDRVPLASAALNATRAYRQRSPAA